MRGGEAHPFMTVKVERTLPRPRFRGEETLNQQHCPLPPAAGCRKVLMPRNGGAPNKRLYPRMNCEGLS
jgi:hypothetical protein